MSLKGVSLFLFAIFFSFALNGCSKVELPMSDGTMRSLSDYSGKWVFINYWAIWCKPCIEEIPELNAFDKVDDVVVLGYNFDRKQGKALADEAEKLDIQFPLLAHDPSALFEQSKPSALPATMLIGPDGTFRKWLMGPQTKDTLAKYIQ